DLSRVWAGPLAGRILGDLGADVIKIESPLVRALAAPNARHFGPDAGPQRPMLSQNKLARNKRSLCIDLRQPEGVELVKRLAAKADVLVENFSARVMPNFGLGYETLRVLNPGLIMLGMPGYGATGPYKNYLGYGPSSEAMTGMAALLGYPGEEPLNSAIAYPDAVAGLMGAAAVMTALVQRARTGDGAFLDLSQLEPTTAMLGEYFLEYQMTGQRPPRLGNRHPYWAPQGTYRCRGHDDWISLCVRSDEEWQRFCAVTGIAPRAEWATVAGRSAAMDEIDAEIARWTGTRSKFEAMQALQAAGIPAGAVLNAKELYEDPQLAARGFFIAARAPEGGNYPMPGTPITVDGERREEWRAAPYPGEHNREVLAELLGMADGAIAALEAQGVLVGPAPVA
ncbi:MAG TPA: CoA transferase, partial [Dehalococcoidia bacterium]|nr:CoA transferase [Dehalococcoidia bacterium]